MTAWGTRPYDNDEAASFAVRLDALPPEDHDAFIRTALTREPAELRRHWQEAVAAAAVVAVQCPTGRLLDIGYGPARPVAALPTDLRSHAAAALALVSEGQHDTDSPASATLHALWRARTASLRETLITDSAPSPAQVPGSMHLPPVRPHTTTGPRRTLAP
ncbi:DUF4259 domain-containing protein [Streptomyces sp. GZWMJZ-114]|uniref:DUF4259 domain-containing protein n=1 Tax=Streptomyces sp. GZWMJZ-114 TaxID=2494734 RepID=UPI0013E99963|nr:DUF4259 domain-containing protein [Streptomyces sp. GZWMJZ-114]